MSKKLTPKQKERRERLMPKGIPKYIRVYDNGGKTADRYAVCFTGPYRQRIDDPNYRINYGSFTWFQHLAMSADPFWPQGVGMHGEHQNQIDVNKWGFAPAIGRKCHLGTRITFKQLPKDCKKLTLRDYKTIWNLT